MIKEVKNPLDLIEDVVRTAKSLEEVGQRVEDELNKGGYCIVSQSVIEQKIASCWQGKERARARALARLKERYKGAS
ncbi:MAG: hypothetical protein A2896_00460 [Candidatus Nealsonbacteria bacterium RIFCSPLOWO2_01_FULL_43_32]|uniref:Uncharacterized protein n=1 Tax=Candidatus Nealsonbacteria bacterium RIFCSPLOWO2_01_FULL_43_32 TaxID=1801672 RepID=A0A1G2EEI2_9BACT|nr:MAG: hypothetical protein A2896_00460 [Candidatus Nealsonbacteria bacterium RIFCSPLOWO2_01_FULL_43_32]